MAKKPKQDDKEQSERFIETAKKLESDKTGNAFHKAVDAVIPKKKRAKPPGRVK